MESDNGDEDQLEDLGEFGVDQHKKDTNSEKVL